MKQRNETICRSDDNQEDVVLDYNDILMPNDIVYDDGDHKPFPYLESDMGPIDQNDYITAEELEVITPAIEPKRLKKSTSVAALPTKVKKTKSNTGNKTNVDKYVNLLLQEDITASLKSLEKKYRKDHMDEGGLCEQCGLSFSNSQEYKKHIRGHDEKGRFGHFLSMIFQNLMNCALFSLLQQRTPSSSNVNSARRVSIINKLTIFISILTRMKSNTNATCAENN